LRKLGIATIQIHCNEWAVLEQQKQQERFLKELIEAEEARIASRAIGD